MVNKKKEIEFGLVFLVLLLFLPLVSSSLFGYNSNTNSVIIEGNKTTYNNNSYYNITGAITNASSITCAGTDKLSAFNNATGLFTCTTDDTTATGLSSAEVNNTINNYLGSANASYLTTSNSTYDSYALNVSRNWTLDAHNNWGSWWFNQTANLVLSGDNASWNESYANTLYTNKSGYNTTQIESSSGLVNIKESWLTSLITSLFDGLFRNFFNQQLNTTNNALFTRLNVSTGYLCNSTDCFSLTDLNSTGSADLTNYYTKVETDNNLSLYLLVTDQRFNETSLALAINNTAKDKFNSTYDAYALNVSLNYTKIVYDTWNSLWGGSSYNSTYDSYALNVSRNWTLDTYNNWNLSWSSTYNETYNAFALNVSLNYTKIVYDTYNSLWGVGGNSTFNQSLTDTLYSEIIWGYNQTTEAINSLNSTYGAWWFNQTANLVITGISSADVNATINTYLGDSNSSYLSTYNSTYDAYPTNWNSSINQYLNSGTNTSYLTTYNSTYDSYALNVSLNYTKIVYDAYNPLWGGSSGMANYSNFSNSTSNWNTLNGIYNNTNSTQMTDTDGTLSISENWIASFLVSIWINYFDQQLNISSSPTFTNLNVTTNLTNQETIYAGNITYYANGCYRKVNSTGLYDIC
jgi:hypothetical protein